MSFDFKIDLYKIFIVFLLTFVLINSVLILKSNFIFCIYSVVLTYFYFPTSIYYLFNEVSFLPSLVTSTLLGLIILFRNIKIKEFKYEIKIFHKFNPVNVLWLISFCMFIPFIYVYKDSINLSNLLFQDIYATREDLSNLSNPIVAYFQSPLVRVITPILLIKSIENKRRILFLYAVTVIIFVFLTGAIKSNLMLLFLLIVFYFCSNYLKTTLLYLYGVAGLCILALIEFFKFNNHALTDYFVRRVFFVPPMLDASYYEHFTNNYLYWSYTRLGSIFYENQVYGRNVSRFMGDIIGGNNLNANVGILTEGYLSAGLIGAFIMCLVFTLLIIFLHSVRIDSKYFGLIFFYFYILNTSFFETSLLTHGVLYFIILSPIFMKTVKDSV